MSRNNRVIEKSENEGGLLVSQNDSTQIQSNNKINHTKHRSYSLSPENEKYLDCPQLGENPLFLFTLAYSQLIEAIADTLFPPNPIKDANGAEHLFKASEARIDRHIHYRAAWQRDFGSALQLALRDLTDTSIKLSGGNHFALLPENSRSSLLTDLQKGKLPPSQWLSPRSQIESFNLIYEAISCGLLSDPGYGGNYQDIGWLYTSFMSV